MALEQTLFGRYRFQNGTVFQALERAGKKWRVYHEGIPQAVTLDGMKSRFFTHDFRRMLHFEQDLAEPYPFAYTFLEPHYGGLADTEYQKGNSQHPDGDIQAGEALIRRVYLALRHSALWEHSLLLITYDEHGGFYDHVLPGAAVPPGDEPRYASENGPGLQFDFSLQGARVPAVAVSPWIRKNTIDHRICGHASISKTLSELFQSRGLTARDAAATSLVPLLSLDEARQDCSLDLPRPGVDLMGGDLSEEEKNGPLEGFTLQLTHLAAGVERYLDPHRAKEILLGLKGLKTRANAYEYLHKVHGRVADLRDAHFIGRFFQHLRWAFLHTMTLFREA
jgi:phospholipase C